MRDGVQAPKAGPNRGKPGVPVVQTRRGVVRFPLTGDETLDAALAGIAERGGCVLRSPVVELGPA